MTSALRFLRQVVAPNGRHRLRPVLLPDEPIPTPEVPARGTVLCEADLLRLLDGGEAEVLTGARCPCCDCTTPHAMGRETRRCWECGTTTPAGGLS